MNVNIENLYHYTSVDGFKSIIENHYFRLSESSFLNDPDDCKLFNDFHFNALTLQVFHYFLYDFIVFGGNAKLR